MVNSISFLSGLALVIISFIITVDAIPAYLPSCSWINDAQPGGVFNRMQVDNISNSTTGCKISIDNRGSSTFEPCKQYVITVTSSENYGHALSLSGSGKLLPHASTSSYEIQSGCRGIQKQKKSTYIFSAPASGSVKLSALCGDVKNMFTAPKVSLSASSTLPQCLDPSTKSPTSNPSKKPISCNGLSKKKCKKFSTCSWSNGQCVPK